MYKKGILSAVAAAAMERIAVKIDDLVDSVQVCANLPLQHSESPARSPPQTKGSFAGDSLRSATAFDTLPLTR